MPMTRTRHALTGADYEAEGPDMVRVVDGDRWGRFDGHGGWIDGDIIQCDTQLCIWLTGLLIVQSRAPALTPAPPAGSEGNRQ
jgi:hypothetical protein